MIRCEVVKEAEAEMVRWRNITMLDEAVKVGEGDS